VRELLVGDLSVTAVTLSTADLARGSEGVRVRDPTTSVVVTCRGSIVASHAALDDDLALWGVPTLCRVLLAGAFSGTVDLTWLLWGQAATVLIITVNVAITVVVLTVLAVDLRAGLVCPTWEADRGITLSAD
jgi:hypothetical protein